MSKLSTLSDVQLQRHYHETCDTDAVAIMYERYGHLVFGVCLKFLESREDAKDATIEVFSEVIEKWKDIEVRNYPAWLHILAKNKCLNKRDRHKRYMNILNQNREYFLEIEESPNELETQLQQMEEALEALSYAQKNCITLFYLKKMSYKQISIALNMSEGDVRSHIQNGRRNLKNLMKKAI